MDEFLARPRERGSQKIDNSGLLAHSLNTARKARELVSGMGIEDSAFYSGLLHDVGKLNPYYQLLFSSDPSKQQAVKKQLDREYLRAHAIFSALAVYDLANIAALPKLVQKQILFAVAGHHTKLTQFYKSLGYCDRNKERFERSFKGTYDNLLRFSKYVKEIQELKGLDWDECLSNFQDQIIPMSETNYRGDEKNFVADFLCFSSAYSALIQADRGSFFEKFPQPAFGISLNTDVLVRADSTLSRVRMNFQERLLLENKFQDNLLILKAPTGIGKTKIFLDIVNKLSQNRHFERVFYFSPLLALTDDFEGKLFPKMIEKTNLFQGQYMPSVLNPVDAEKVLVYNHMFTGSLLKKQSKDSNASLDEEAEDPQFKRTPEYFERESFNKELIITTTQRLLMVLYSNDHADKEKLLSFKNSFLIIDEVQTIPKVILPNFIALLKALTAKYNSRILLVSATIPDELQGLPMLATSSELEKQYLRMTVKQIQYLEERLDAKEVSLLGGNGHTLFMFNTRRKASAFFEKLHSLRPDALYLSTGIRKCDREQIIQEKLHGKTPVTVVSTQVLEAGVDVSFSRMYREMAPLDNIVQAMGRLNREGEDSNPVLKVFCDDGDYKPYSQLEVDESKKWIPKLNSSIDLYNALPEYYKMVSAENQSNKNLAKELDDKMRNLNFDDVWDFIKKHALPDQLGDSVLSPSPQKWEEVKQFLSSDSSRGHGKLDRYAKFMAQLPGFLEEIEGLEGLLDEELLEKGVFMPKKEHLSTVYDPKVGLDKWVKKK